jgi:hypothetical protein
MADQLIMDDRRGQPNLSELDDAARQGRFQVLQQRMEPVWDAWGLDLPDESVVVVPSVPVSRGWPRVRRSPRRSRSGFSSYCCCCASHGCG